MRGVLLILFCLTASGLAGRNFIESACPDTPIPRVPEGTSGSRTINYPVPSTGVVNCTVVAMSRCNQSVDNNLLIGRSWYITQDKAYFGQGYNPRFFQAYDVQCPEGHFLNIGFQARTELVCATPGDTIRIDTDRQDTGDICANSQPLPPDVIYDRPGGIITENASAVLEFCSDEDGMNTGFAVRATCINPELVYDQTSCVSYPFFLRWDPEFVNKIAMAFDMRVDTTQTPHKRSAQEEEEGLFYYLKDKIDELTAIGKEQERKLKEEYEDDEREKRGVRYMFDFPAGTMVVFSDYMMTFTFPNGTVRSFRVYRLTATNDLYGTRYYFQNATRQVGDATGETLITFTGPGSVDIFPNGQRTSINAILRWTPTMPFETFLENSGIQQQFIAGQIYDYIYDQWVAPYVVVDDFLIEGLSPKPYPTSGGRRGRDRIFFPPNTRTRDNIRVLFPEISDESICKPVVRFADAPLRNSTIDPDLVSFCSFFQRACDPILATACRELMILDPRQQDPSSMMMMGGGD